MSLLEMPLATAGNLLLIEFNIWVRLMDHLKDVKSNRIKNYGDFPPYYGYPPFGGPPPYGGHPP